ncbi:TetR family transcriptional regulator [Virgibacillus profundi]|uniref:TetR family transcriptional regulator n=1 Tax=Virgibacillus profundi TaxID=2024555 RepID=A0A2A2IK06_9BACI|nr:TetR/AcrR family transcriptional regulator [Virgibacillus profundi]PAV31646.1 TetR family transcriptional regulator [Virgibacillus profundi]PXY55832.1 TetR/AcrR family transcriptional regulator [Virgibacillus profundi]
MPKQTFFNLPDDKRQTLILAAEKEFSRVPLFEASISNIVKTAGIPRGSFYQYFEDKEDAYLFLLNQQAKARQGNFIALLSKNDGNLFDAITEMYRLILLEIPTQENLEFLKNAFLNMTHKIENIFTKIFSVNESSEKLREISSMINKENLNISDEDDLTHVIQIIMSVTFHNLVEKFAKELTYEQAMSNFKIEMNLLKNGLCKQGI